MSNRARLNEYQFNVKQTAQEWDKLQAVNDRFFDGKLTNTELGRFLLGFALQKLAEVKTVELTTAFVVDGKTVVEIK